MVRGRGVEKFDKNISTEIVLHNFFDTNCLTKIVRQFCLTKIVPTEIVRQKMFDRNLFRPECSEGLPFLRLEFPEGDMRSTGCATKSCPGFHNFGMKISKIGLWP